MIEELTALGVRAGDLSIARVQVVRPMTQEGYSIELESQTDTLVWSEVADEAVDNIGLRPSYLAYMAVAGVIAAFGVIDRSAMLIVGAMAVSPDLLPLTAASVGIVARRRGCSAGPSARCCPASPPPSWRRGWSRSRCARPAWSTWTPTSGRASSPASPTSR